MVRGKRGESVEEGKQWGGEESRAAQHTPKHVPKTGRVQNKRAGAWVVRC